MGLWYRRANLCVCTCSGELCLVGWLVAIKSTHKHEAIKQKFARLEKKRELWQRQGKK